MHSNSGTPECHFDKSATGVALKLISESAIVLAIIILQSGAIKWHSQEKKSVLGNRDYWM